MSNNKSEFRDRFCARQMHQIVPTNDTKMKRIMNGTYSTVIVLRFGEVFDPLALELDI